MNVKTLLEAAHECSKIIRISMIGSSWSWRSCFVVLVMCLKSDMQAHQPHAMPPQAVVAFPVFCLNTILHMLLNVSIYHMNFYQRNIVHIF
jgi:hypothetical protein